MKRLHDVSIEPHGRSGRATFVGALPSPSVAKKELRQQMQHGGLRPAIGDRQANQKIVGRFFRILRGHIEVTGFVERGESVSSYSGSVRSRCRLMLTSSSYG